MTSSSDIEDALLDELDSVLVGNTEPVRRLLIALLTGGHVLLEGVPGVAKTTLANLFARATGLSYSRIQMTPDTLPADITGTHVYREPTGEFELQKGPVFANIVLADEINRATPKTQSALLEAMQEDHVTIEGDTLDLPDPFMVIATQNPIEYEGTYELPIAQRDRFQFKLQMAIPSLEDERTLVDRFNERPALGPGAVSQVIDHDELREAQEEVGTVYVDDRVRDYFLAIVNATRDNSNIEHGVSPRAALMFLIASKARAAILGRDYVIPDDVKHLANPILVHRIILSTDAELREVTPEEVVESILNTVRPPGSDVEMAEGLAANGGIEDHSEDDEELGGD